LVCGDDGIEDFGACTGGVVASESVVHWANAWGKGWLCVGVWQTEKRGSGLVRCGRRVWERGILCWARGWGGAVGAEVW
jgi:hypothetical protein